MIKNSNKKNKLVPLNDHAFKRMFGDVGCEPQLIILLNGLTNRTGKDSIKKLKIIEKEIPREHYGDKEIRLDVVAITDNGEQFNIEAQLRNVDMGPRSAFYGSRQLVNSVKKGQDYNTMIKSRVITIFGSKSKERDKQKGYYKYEKSNEFFERYEFDLHKFESLENKDINNPQHRCLMFLSENTDEKMRKKVIKMDPELGKAQEILDHINSSPGEIELYEMRELVKMDIKNARKRDMQEGIEIGKEEGIEKGKEVEKIEVALLSIKENLPTKTIRKLTGLSVKKIEKLRQKQE